MGCKYIFVTGGVVSGLGKGTTGAALGRLLKARGLVVAMQKQDPYLNVDPGTMSPFQHGEVFVTDDGAECDLDLGHYERFTDENMSENSTYTSGKIYWSVLERERTGDFLGGTVQVIPHITNEIKNGIYRLGRPGVDVAIVEIGGTVGDMESRPHLEAIRQIAAEVGRANVCFVHVSLVVQIPGTGELKSKPTQHSVSTLLSMGIQPDVIVARADLPLGRDIREKISLFCNIPIDCVIENANVKSLYELPVMLRAEGLDSAVCKRLGLGDNPPDMGEWEAMLRRYRGAHDVVRIALVGKYIGLHDAYLSVSEALYHGAIENDVRVEITWVDSELLTQQNAAELLSGVHGVLVPGGFGDRGTEGMVAAVEYARTNEIPFFGICLGMQTAVIEAARNLLGHSDANSTEFAPTTAHPVIDIMADQCDVEAKGGTMRLGSYPCRLMLHSKAHGLYAADQISERHRHRYEFNNAYREAFSRVGLEISGLSPDGKLVEMIELKAHPWFVGVQFHPEFKSRPTRAHPLFRGFVEAAKEHARLALA